MYALSPGPYLLFTPLATIHSLLDEFLRILFPLWAENRWSVFVPRVGDISGLAKIYKYLHKRPRTSQLPKVMSQRISLSTR